MLRWFPSFLLVLSLLIGCEHPLPSLDGMNLADWKNDKKGCDGKRESMIAILQAQKSKLQGLSEMQIIELLGRPDHNELYTRNQKFFLYSLECERDSSARKLSVRFNATGRAKEVLLTPRPSP